MDDIRYGTVYHGYVINRKASPYCEYSTPDANELKCWDVTMYDILTNWGYVDTLRTQTFDNNGQNYVEDITVTTYGNQDHALPTKIWSKNSDQKESTVNRYYPADLSLTGSEESARLALLSKHILSPVLREQMNKNTSPVTTVELGYNIFPSGNVLPLIKRVQIGQNAIENRFNFVDYESHGKLLAQAKTGDVQSSYIWSASGKYLCAQTINATYDSSAYTSFEFDDPNNWSYSSGSITSIASITGINSYQLSSSSPISKGGLISGDAYIVSYWSNSGSYNISGATVAETKAGRNVNGWIYYQQLISATSTLVSITGAGLIDELRLYPKGAQMTTYTYDPLIGITSVADPNGEITYYEYDAFNRLKNVKDYQGNIVKNFQYNYRNSCGTNCSIYPMQTFNGNNTLGYPVGVFSADNKLIGNATNQTDFISLWNGNSVNHTIGTLSAGSDPLHFNLIVNANQQAPSTITGCRYYQFDFDYTEIDAIRNTNGAFVDFGDGASMKLGTYKQDTTVVVALNTTMNFFTDPNNPHDLPYFIHTYPNNNVKTITIYHNDGTENPAFDNLHNPATSLGHISNIRGNYPQCMTVIGSSCLQSPTASSVTGIANWSSITSVLSFNPNLGDHVNPVRNLTYAQDFLANDKGLTTIFTTSGLYSPGYSDSTFKISRLKSDWNVYFTHLQNITINDDQWDREDVSALTQLSRFILNAGTVEHGVGGTMVPIPSQVVDNILNQISAGAGRFVSNGLIGINSATNRTTASDAAVAQLKAKGWTIIVSNVSQ